MGASARVRRAARTQKMHGALPICLINTRARRRRECIMRDERSDLEFNNIIAIFLAETVIKSRSPARRASFISIT